MICRSLAMLLLLAPSCGYRFTAGGAPLPEGIRAVRAPLFHNRTSEPGIEATFTQALREQLLRAGVEGGASAEAEIQGEVQVATSNPTIVTTTTGQLASYRLYAQVLVRLLKGGRVVTETAVGGTEDYLPGADVLASESNRQAAIRRLADTLMRDAYARLTIGW